MTVAGQFFDVFSVNEITNICSELNNRLEYVSLYDAYKWYLGSVIYWDRKMLHCSDNFLKNGLAEKNALVLFTNHSE
jgi:hypothetical protein